MDNSGVLILIVILAIVIYLIPSFVASNHKNSGAIFALNILLGWTFIGWIIALVWALTDGKKTTPIIAPSASISDEIAKLHELKGKGVLSESEFNEAKSRIIK